jgi:hypothetical protein
MPLRRTYLELQIVSQLDVTYSTNRSSSNFALVFLPKNVFPRVSWSLEYVRNTTPSSKRTLASYVSTYTSCSAQVSKFLQASV